MFSMAEEDYVIRDLKLGYSGILDFNELYKLLKSWFSSHKYVLAEADYNDVFKGELKDMRIKFKADRMVDDYHKFTIEVGITIENHEVVVNKNKKFCKGNLKLKFESYVVRDYEETWEGRPVQKFFRGLYDKFVAGEKGSELNKELKEETYEIFNEVKSFLNLYKFE